MRLITSREGDELEIDTEKGILRNLTKGTSFMFNPLPPFIQEIIDAGGLLLSLKKRIASNR